MPNVKIHIPTPLRPLVDDRESVRVEAATVEEALERLTSENRQLRSQLYGDRGELRNFVNVYLGERHIRDLDGDEPLVEDAELRIVPSIAGGSKSVETPAPADRVEAPGTEEEKKKKEKKKGADRPAGPPDLLAGRALPDLSPEEIRRYGRHLSMPEVGREGQERLKAGRVLLVGAGGLGSPASLYLAAAGVGHLGLVDFDEVEFSNLHRQILHGTEDVGRAKLESARERLRAVNPEVAIETHEARLDSSNALEIMEGYDLVLDGSDNFPTRYLVNDASVMSGIPSVWGAIYRFEGQVSVFGLEDGPCYRCLFREPPPPGLVPSCAEAGVLGVLPGVIGTIQATEAIKLLLGKGRPLAGRLLLLDALDMSFREVPVRADPECPVCGEEPTVTELIDYEAFCGVADEGTAGEGAGVPEIDVEELRRLHEEGEEYQLLDVREDYEWEICNLEELGARRIPLGELPDRLGEVAEERPLVVHCRSGGRSATAVELLRRAGFEEAYNLAGGVLAWADRVDPEMEKY